MKEAETRAERTNPALKAAGWGVVTGSHTLREHGITLGRLQGDSKGGQSNREVFRVRATKHGQTLFKQCVDFLAPRSS